jgi:glutathione synthase/RimK-type ligase-like ATP-grasp enzyme
MDETSIGIILPKRQWKSLVYEQMNDEEDSSIFHYAKSGEELNLKVLFFNIDELLANECKGKAFIIKEQEVINLGIVKIPAIVYNPATYHRKKHNRTIFELARRTGVTVINEQNKIKNNSFLELLDSHPALKDEITIAEDQTEPSFSIYVLGQKDSYHHWTTPLVYAKNHEEIYTFEEAYKQLSENIGMLDETKVCLYESSHRILEILHYYYPAIYEIGLKFVMTKTGEVRIQSTCSIDCIVKDISICNKKLADMILHWPLELAKELSEMGNHYNEETNLEQITEELRDDKLTPFTGRGNQLNECFWVKFKIFDADEMQIKLPHRIAEQWKEQPEAVKFGVNELPCQFVIYEDAIPLRHNSYHNPVDLFVSHTLVENLHLPVDLVYQIQFSEGRAIIGPTIGLLLGEKNKVYNLKYMEKYNDRFGEYHCFGGVIIAFSARSVDWEKRIAYGMVYDPLKKHWRYDAIPIPATIYRRNFHQKKKDIQLLKKITNNNLFNSYHFKKSDLYLLKDNPEINEHLPSTFLLNNIEELIEFLHVNKKIILKPVSLSRGRGIFILELDSELGGYSLYDYRSMTKVQHRLKDIEGLQALLEEIGILNQEYLFQTYIPLLKVNNRALDVRVVMQKYNQRKWHCTGIECRVARENEDLTNIARGGEAMTLETVIKNSRQGLNYSHVKRNILNLCQRFCRIMDQKNEHFAEFGIDIALDDEGFPWILEANIYPSFKGFKTLDYDTYLRIRNQPLFYSVQIQGFQILDDHAVGKAVQFRERTYL